VLRIPKDGAYTFFTASDDGSKLFIGDTEVVDNDGVHGVVEKSGVIELKAGLHPIRVIFAQGGGGRALRVSYDGPGIARQDVPEAGLYHEKDGK